MKSIQYLLGELLETMVREASTRAFKEYDRKLKQQQETVSELKESVGMIQRQLRSFGANITPQPLIRTSAYDIRNFRKKLGITQEVFAQMLHVNTRTIIRWERSIAVPHLTTNHWPRALPAPTAGRSSLTPANSIRRKPWRKR